VSAQTANFQVKNVEKKGWKKRGESKKSKEKTPEGKRPFWQKLRNERSSFSDQSRRWPVVFARERGSATRATQEGEQEGTQLEAS